MSNEPPQSADEIISRYSNGERQFNNADLDDDADFTSANLENAVFEHCFISDASFRNAHLRGVVFRNCNVKCSDFRQADLRNANFYGSSIEAIFLEAANLEGTSFEGAWYHGHELRKGERPPD